MTTNIRATNEQNNDIIKKISHWRHLSGFQVSINHICEKPRWTLIHQSGLRLHRLIPSFAQRDTDHQLSLSRPDGYNERLEGHPPKFPLPQNSGESAPLQGELLVPYKANNWPREARCSGYTVFALR